jgi:hypothetical protein
MKRKTCKKVYKDGGKFDAGLIGAIGGTGFSLLDGLTPMDKAPSVGLGAGKGMMSGVAAGAQFGGVGAVVGGVLGAVGGALGARKQQRMFAKQEALEDEYEKRNISAQAAAAHANNPALAYGYRNTSYYARGGRLPMLSKVHASGGTLAPLSSRHTEVQGPSHAQGGVNLPAYNAEVEGGETTSGSMIFSKDLGFAQLHKPIAKAIGKIEVKPATTERLNALKRLQAREQELFQLQEQLKSYGQV